MTEQALPLPTVPTDALDLIPLGGVGEIGKNMWCLRTTEGIIILDCGFAFPSEEMFGVDLVLPDFSFVLAHATDVRAIFLSHGHEDHIGGLPFLLKLLPVPIYATALTMSLIEGKLSEHGLLGRIPLRVIRPRESVKIGDITVEGIRVCHSIADAVAFKVSTAVGSILYTGDFKFDPTPIDGELTDYFKLTEMGEDGLLLLMSDSTNVNKKGITPSEAAVAPALDRVFVSAKHRIIVTTFASNIHRVQQILNAASRHGRKVVFLGRSMLNVTTRARQLGYLSHPDDLVIPIEALKHFPPEAVVILTTGSQGEPLAALSRITFTDHKGIRVQAGDTVLISAIPIPGNERSVGRIINQLFALGAEVVYESVQQGTHVSGHASEEELKMMLAFTRPRFFLPIHGEVRHLVRHAALASSMGIPAENIAIVNNGDILRVQQSGVAVIGQVPSQPTLVDGQLRYDVGQSLLRERQKLANDGVVTTALSVSAAGRILSGPHIVTRGCIDGADTDAIIQEGTWRVLDVVSAHMERGPLDPERLRRQISEALARFFNEKTRRKPLQIVHLSVDSQT